MKIFFDAGFTGLHQNTTLISLGLVTETGETFYSEFTDYDESQVDNWIEENVLSSLSYNKTPFHSWKIGSVELSGHHSFIRGILSRWLEKFGQIEMWGDCLSWDWVLFCELFGGAFGIPKKIFYLPFDICTLFKLKGIDPDTNREKFAGVEGLKHNALWDAHIIKACYEKLVKEE